MSASQKKLLKGILGRPPLVPESAFSAPITQYSQAEDSFPLGRHDPDQDESDMILSY